jgi:hypothetical protein
MGMLSLLLFMLLTDLTEFTMAGDFSPLLREPWKGWPLVHPRHGERQCPRADGQDIRERFSPPPDFGATVLYTLISIAIMSRI